MLKHKFKNGDRVKIIKCYSANSGVGWYSNSIGKERIIEKLILNEIENISHPVVDCCEKKDRCEHLWYRLENLDTIDTNFYREDDLQFVIFEKELSSKIRLELKQWKKVLGVNKNENL